MSKYIYTVEQYNESGKHVNEYSVQSDNPLFAPEELGLPEHVVAGNLVQNERYRVWRKHPERRDTLFDEPEEFVSDDQTHTVITLLCGTDYPYRDELWSLLERDTSVHDHFSDEFGWTVNDWVLIDPFQFEDAAARGYALAITEIYVDGSYEWWRGGYGDGRAYAGGTDNVYSDDGKNGVDLSEALRRAQMREYEGRPVNYWIQLS